MRETGGGGSATKMLPLDVIVLAHVGRKGPTHVGNRPWEIHSGVRRQLLLLVELPPVLCLELIAPYGAPDRNCIFLY